MVHYFALIFLSGVFVILFCFLDNCLALFVSVSMFGIMEFSMLFLLPICLHLFSFYLNNY